MRGVLAGHYSAAFLAKAAAPRTPLWLLALAVQLVDVLFAGLVLAGVERMSLDASLPSNPLVLEHMPYTHSLLGTLVWAALAGFATYHAARIRRLPASSSVAASTAVAVAAAVASHWLLDVLVHRPDMTLFGVPPKLGLGLWNFPAPALALELGLLVASAQACLRSGALPARGVFVLVGALAAVQLATLLSPPALGPNGVAASLLVLVAAVAWGARRVERT
jgi:membrane-bound metal-dependent hydrolase YbcI (DUF457 family)